MVAVSITEKEAIALVSSTDYIGKVSINHKVNFHSFCNSYRLVPYIAAVNSPSNVTLSGDAKEIECIAASMKEKDVFAQVLPTCCLYH